MARATVTDETLVAPSPGLLQRLGGQGIRRIVIQAVAVALALAFILYIGSNVALNLQRLGVRTGFGFLERPAGFEIAQSLLPYDEQSTYFAAFLVALTNTIAVTLVCIVLATALGFVVGLARLSSNRLMAAAASAYVELFRNIPLLLHLLFWYFALLQPLPGPKNSLDLFGLVFLNSRGLFLPALTFEGPTGLPLAALALGAAVSFAIARLTKRRRVMTGRRPIYSWLAPLPLLLLPAAALLACATQIGVSVPHLQGFNFRGGLAIIPEFVALSGALSLFEAAFIAEIVRGGISAIPRGQVEAGQALGLSRLRITVEIVVPLALRVIVPPLGAQYVQILKSTSLAAAIAYPDLMLVFAGTTLNQTGQPLEVMAITLATYLGLGFALSCATGLVNRRLLLVTR
ncbi:general L-amino acid transport system permease protein [Rhizobiales bacterium GAS113]|nr:general L-amino acid transport system permease protein [Rhizobiales bacterium GAS113]